MVYAMNFADSGVNPLAKVSSLGSLINLAIPIITIVAALIFLFMLISGAFKYITAGDSPEQVKKAQSTFITAIIGLVIVVCAYLIVKLLGYIFKVDMPL